MPLANSVTQWIGTAITTLIGLLITLHFVRATLGLVIADRTQEALLLGFAVGYRPLATGFDFAERSHQGLDMLVRRLAEVPPNGFVEVQIH